jgi:diaminohydroxyphosphoribosylaminopyrimidine deaminase/5-amino-6-(5-phosphoribosylamino)uracil reductase
MTLDGRIATRTRQSKWITGQTARRHGHMLRDHADAVLVGAGTVREDDPRLTTRLPDEYTGAGGAHHPLRVIVDGQGTTSPAATVYDPSLPGRTLVATTAAATPHWRDELAARGVESVICELGSSVDLGQVLDLLGGIGINDLLVEGGGAILGSFVDAGLVDRAAVFLAPIVVGGSAALGPIGGHGCASVADAWRLANVRIHALGRLRCIFAAQPFWTGRASATALP